jgi:kumamolisin
MANQEHLDLLAQGPRIWAKWRAANPDITPDFRGAAMTEVLLRDISLRAADLREAKFGTSNLEETDLREADLQGADLSAAIGLIPDQLAGADLTRTRLPDPVKSTFEELKSAKDISENAQKLFIAMLAACFYSWLTIASTTDASLITDRASSPLPIIQVSIPIVNFFIVAPLLLTGVYFYFHFYLQKLWEELGSLPAIFPDGKALQTKADPWLLSDLVRSHVAKLRSARPFLSYFQSWVSALLVWWSVPITLLLFWLRYLPRHEIDITIFHCSIAAACICGGVFSYRLAANTLRGVERQSFIWKRALIQPSTYRIIAFWIVSALGLFAVSFGAINGARTAVSGHDCWSQAKGPTTWVPQTMQFFHISPFANIGAADLALKPANWAPQDDLEKVQGLVLYRADLRYADLKSAFLPVSILTEARLNGADLLAADLRQSQFMGAHLEGADLAGADLRDANLSGADLSRANLIGTNLEGANLKDADLKYADLSRANGLTAAQIKSAKNGNKAYFDDQMLLSAPELSSDFKDYDANSLEQEQQRLDGRATTWASQTDCEAAELGRLIPGKGKVATGLQLSVLTLHHVGGRVQVQQVPVGKEEVVSAADFANYYHFPPGDGAGQRIGIIEFGGGYFKEDLATYFHSVNSGHGTGGVEVPSIRTIPVRAPAYDLHQILALNPAQRKENLDDSVQVMMDVEIVASLCPKADIGIYFSKFSPDGWVAAINAVVSEKNPPSVVLVNWGLTEVDPVWSNGGLERVEEALQRAANSGITIVTASGDDGASDELMDGLPHVSFPASSPWVLAVGGTMISKTDVLGSSEKPWYESPGYRSGGGAATGGGVSEKFPLPEWQISKGIPMRRGNQRGRGVPDVAASFGLYDLVFTGQRSPNGGTGASAALWAGLITRLNQNLGRNLGYFNPILYGKIDPTLVLHSVMGGSNGNKQTKGYPCQLGWNACTGWGVPDGQELLAALRRAVP